MLKPDSAHLSRFSSPADAVDGTQQHNTKIYTHTNNIILIKKEPPATGALPHAKAACPISTAPDTPSPRTAPRTRTTSRKCPPRRCHYKSPAAPHDSTTAATRRGHPRHCARNARRRARASVAVPRRPAPPLRPPLLSAERARGASCASCFPPLRRPPRFLCVVLFAAQIWRVLKHTCLPGWDPGLLNLLLFLGESGTSHGFVREAEVFALASMIVSFHKRQGNGQRSPSQTPAFLRERHGMCLCRSAICT